MPCSELSVNTEGVSIHRKENIDPEMDVNMSISFSDAVVSTQNPEKKKSIGISSSSNDSTQSQHDSGVKMTPSDCSLDDDTTAWSIQEPVINERKTRRKRLSEYTIESDEDRLAECFKVDDETLTKQKPKRKHLSEYTMDSDDSLSSCFKVPNEVKKDKLDRKRIFDCTNHDIIHLSDCFKIEDEPKKEKPNRKGAFNYTMNISSLSNCFKPDAEEPQKEPRKRKGAFNYTIDVDISGLSDCFKVEAEESMKIKPKRKGLLDFTNESSDSMSSCFKPEDSEIEKPKRKRLLDYTTESIGSFSTCFKVNETESEPRKLKSKRLAEYTNDLEDNMSHCFRTEGTESQTPTSENIPILNQTYSIAVNTPKIKINEETVTLSAPDSTFTENETPGGQSKSMEQSVSVQSIMESERADISNADETLVPSSESHVTYEISLERDDTRMTSQTHSNMESEMNITLSPINSVNETNVSNKSSDCPDENSNKTELASKSISSGLDLNDETESPKSNDCTGVDSNNESTASKSNDSSGVNVSNESTIINSNDHVNSVNEVDQEVKSGISNQSLSIVREHVSINPSVTFGSVKTFQGDKTDTIRDDISECIVGASALYSVVVVSVNELDVEDFNKSAVNVSNLDKSPPVLAISEIEMPPGHDLEPPTGSEITEPCKEQVQEPNIESERVDEHVQIDEQPDDRNEIPNDAILSAEKVPSPPELVDCAESTIFDVKNITTEILPPPEIFAHLSSNDDGKTLVQQSNTEKAQISEPMNAEIEETNIESDPVPNVEPADNINKTTDDVIPPEKESLLQAIADCAECTNITAEILPPPAIFANSISSELGRADIEPEQATPVPIEVPAIVDNIPPENQVPLPDGAVSITVILPPPSMFANTICTTPDNVLPPTPANDTNESNLLKTPTPAESETPQTRRSTRSRKSNTDSEKSSNSSGRPSRKRSFNSALSNYSLRSRPSLSSEGSQNTVTTKSTTMFSMSRIGRVPVDSTVCSPEVEPPPKKKRSRAKTNDSLRLKNLPSKPNFPKFDFYFNQRFYKYLISKMEPKFGILTNVKVVKLAKFIDDVVKKCTWMKDGYQEIVHNMKLQLRKYDVITTPYDFYIFCWDYMPPLFQLKAIPMKSPCNYPPNIEMDPEPWEPIEL